MVGYTEKRKNHISLFSFYKHILYRKYWEILRKFVWLPEKQECIPMCLIPLCCNSDCVDHSFTKAFIRMHILWELQYDVAAFCYERWDNQIG
jgi:hypothetical protein